MSSDWPLLPLDQLAREVTVGFVGTMVDQYVSDGVPFLRSLNISPFEIDKGDLKFISPEFHAKLKKSALSPGDVTVVRTGKPGTCAVVPAWLKDANCSDLVLVRCGPQLRPDFLCFWINTAASHHIAANLVGAVQQHFNVSAAKRMLVACPPLPEQDKVIELVGGINDRITLLRETNTTLEAIAQALFKSWFVDFDPVRAKMAGRAPEGMDEATAALFPDSFEDSELGEVPRGWGLSSLGKLCKLEWGNTTITKKSYVACGYPAFSAAGQDGFVATAERSGIGSVISAIGTVGVVHLAHGEWTAIKNTLTAQCESDAESLFLHFLLLTVRFPSRGSTQQFISQADARSVRIKLPPSDLRLRFGNAVQALIERLVTNKSVAAALSELRDTLLPRLISGQLRLPEAKALTEEVMA